MAELFNAGLAVADVALSAKWREEEVKYRKLEILRRQIDEKVEQLRSIANLAALIAGFEVVVLIELDVPSNAPQWLVALFAMTTATTVCIMSLSFVTCTLMLVGVLKAFDLERANMPFRQFWVLKCEEDWMRAFWFFTAGVPSFMINLGLAAWVKFFNNPWAASLVTVVCVLAVLAWAQIHLKWGSYLAEQATYNVHQQQLQQLQHQHQHQDQHGEARHQRRHPDEYDDDDDEHRDHNEGSGDGHGNGYGVEDGHSASVGHNATAHASVVLS